MEQADSLFWADQIAKEISERKKFHYIDKEIKPMKKFVVKSAASVSGVLHIGRLSDTIRVETVYRSLKDAGFKAEFIWTADNVDPLRKIPKGVPQNYREYIGMPVTEIPDPMGCHKSYEEHHKSAYLDIVFQFISSKMKTFSMREEYIKGSFKKEIKKIIKNYETIVEIQNKNRPADRPLPADWSPWQPICENCGKIITPRVINIEDGKVHYVCKDYDFKTEKAIGCGHEGVDDPLKGNGKLLYKSELAAQWFRWKVCSEGFGKEYIVPGSAFWINAEILEKIFKFPMPVPIFYEHLLIDGEKMSASKGNVVYPKEWIEVAEPELLKFFYNKRLMKTRSFSWCDLPNLYDDYDRHMISYFGKTEIKNEREKTHMKRLYEMSQLKKPVFSQQIPYSFAAIITQICKPEESVERAVKLLKFSGYAKSLGKNEKNELQKRLIYSKNWIEKYAPVELRIQINEHAPEEIKEKLNDDEKMALRLMIEELNNESNEEELQSHIYQIARQNAVEPKRFFQLMYQIILNRDNGPRLGPFMFVIGKEKVIRLLEEAAKN